MFYIGMLSPPGKCQTHLRFKQLFWGKRASSRLGCDFHRDIQGWSQWLAVSQDCHLLRCFYCLLVSVRGHPLISKILLSATFNRSFSPLAPVSPKALQPFCQKGQRKPRWKTAERSGDATKRAPKAASGDREIPPTISVELCDRIWSANLGLVTKKTLKGLLPIPSMYSIFTYIWLIFMVNVGKYTIHGSYGLYCWFSIGSSLMNQPRLSLLHVGYRATSSTLLLMVQKSG